MDTAIVIPIPKPEKPPNVLRNLGPISLTFCIRKSMEKMALERLTWHLDATIAFTPTMIAFRSHVNAQDAMIRIKEDVYDFPSAAQLRIIAGLDIKKAFDNVTHQAILKKLHDTNPSTRLYSYIHNFLTDRHFKVIVDGPITAPHHLTHGVPQGAILSPSLFNIAMKELPA